MWIRCWYLARTDIIGMWSECSDCRLWRYVPKFDGCIVRTWKDMGLGQRWEFRDVNRLFVRVQGPKNCAWIRVKYLIVIVSCISLFLTLFGILKSKLTWIRPVSSPATTSLPSPRMHPLRATSLKREIVLITFCVRGAYIWTRVAAVTAYLCGLAGEKCTDVTGAYSLTKTGCLNCRQ